MNCRHHNTTGPCDICASDGYAPSKDFGSATKRQVGGSHYSDMAIGPTVYCHKNHLGPFETIAIRYISRHRAKAGVMDLKKAIHALEMLIELEYDDRMCEMQERELL